MSSLLKFKESMMTKKSLVIIFCLSVTAMISAKPVYEQVSDYFPSLVSSSDEMQATYQGFVDVPNIYYSSNNGKRSKLIMMDLAIEVQDPDTEKRINTNRPIIKSEVLKILSTDNYRHIGDEQLLTFINENVNRDLAPVLQRISTLDAHPEVHVTRLIIQ